MNKDFPELGLTKEDCVELSWVESALYWGNFDYTSPAEVLLDRHSDTAKYMLRKSDYVPTLISKSGWESIFSKLVELGKCCVFKNPYGGIMEEIPTNATLCPHRAGNLFKIQYWINWDENDPKLEEMCLNKIRVLYKFMTKYVSKNPRVVYWNYRHLDIGVMVGVGASGYNSGKVYDEKFFKGNFNRLVKVKTVFDPNNFFMSEQSIPTILPRTSRI